LTPVIWKEYGWDVCKSWLTILNSVKGITELQLCVKFIERQLSKAYNFIKENKIRKEAKENKEINSDEYNGKE